MPVWELVSCAWEGHVLVGTDATEVRHEDRMVAMTAESTEGAARWHRCLRCDAWRLHPVPVDPTRPFPPDQSEISLPLRGRSLRDRYVLRLIAVDRLIHVLVLSALAIALFVIAGRQATLRSDFDRIVNALQAGGGAPVSRHGILGSLRSLFRVTPGHLRIAALVVLAYAALEAAEMVGLWLAQRWAEYLTFVATSALVPFEVYELTKAVSVLKVLTLVINVLIVGYLLLAKRLFGIRGGGRAEDAEREADSGWSALVATTPWLATGPGGSSAPG